MGLTLRLKIGDYIMIGDSKVTLRSIMSKTCSHITVEAEKELNISRHNRPEGKFGKDPYGKKIWEATNNEGKSDDKKD